VAVADVEPDPFAVAALAFSDAEPNTSLPASAAPFTAPPAAPAKISVTAPFALANRPLDFFERDTEVFAFGFAVGDFFAVAFAAGDFFAAGAVFFVLLVLVFFVADFFTVFLLNIH